MKERLLVSLLFCLMICMQVLPSVASAHSQNLQWGYKEGDTFYFHETQKGEGGDAAFELNEDYQLVAGTPPILEDPLTNGSRFPYSHFEVYWLNGSSEDQLFILGSGVAVPIGNWSLLTYMMETKLEQQYISTQNEIYRSQIIDSPDSWGYEKTYVHLDGSLNSTMIERSIFSKQDGVLQEYFFNSSNSFSDSTYQYDFYRLPMNPTTQAILISGFAAGVLIIAIILITRLRKR